MSDRDPDDYTFRVSPRDDDDDDDDDEDEDDDDDSDDDSDDDDSDDDDDDDDDSDDDDSDDDDDDSDDDDSDDDDDDSDDDESDDDDTKAAATTTTPPSSGGGWFGGLLRGVTGGGVASAVSSLLAFDSFGSASSASTATTAYGRSGPAKNSGEFPRYEPGVDAADLPDEVSYEYLFPPVEDQGESPTCVTFATTALVSSILHKRTGQWLDLSRRALYSMTWHHYESNQHPDGGLCEDDALRTYRDLGHVLESDWPWGGANPKIDELIAPVPDQLVRTEYDLKGFQTVETDPDAMMAALHEHGPLLVGMPWHKEWEDVGPDGILPDPSGDRPAEGGHCVVIVGYSKPKNAFRLRNSWGTDWGDRGYAWMPMDRNIAIDDVYTIAL